MQTVLTLAVKRYARAANLGQAVDVIGFDICRAVLPADAGITVAPIS